MEKMNFQFSDRVPLLANMVEGGKTPISGADDLEELGYSIVIFPGGTVRAVSFAMQEYMGQLKKTGSTDLWRNRMFDFRGFNDLIGTPEMLAKGERYADRKD